MSVVFPPKVKTISSAVALAIISSLSSVAVQAESLGVIQVESSTIGDRFEDKRLEPSAVSSISGEQVDRAHTENIQQMLQSIPGITTEVQSGDSLKIHIRGVENQVYMGEKPGVAVVIDGVPVFERTGRVNIDLDNIESIRVVKGGASYLFGDDALSGAVIITTKKGAGQAGYKVAAEVGSFGHTKGLARAGFASDSASGHLQVSQRKTDGYYDDSGSQADYVNGKLQYYVDDNSDLQFGFEVADRHKNSHGAVKGVSAAETDPTSKDPAYNDYANHYQVDLQKLFFTYNRDMDSGANLMVNTYQFSDDTAFFSKPDSTDPSIYYYDNDYAQVQRGIKAEYRQSGDKVAWMVATDLRDNRYENRVIYNADYDPPGPAPVVPAGTAYSDDTTDEGVQALYGELKYRVSDPLLLTLNGRLDHIAFDYTSNLLALELDKSFDVSSWRLGANYALSSGSDIYANVSTGFRAPSITQLFTGDTSPTGTTVNNPDLKPEHSLNLELGYRTKATLLGAPTDIDVGIFQITRDDYIMKTSGQYALPDSTDMYDNIGGVRNRGLELSVDSTVSQKVSLYAAYTYLNAEFTKYDNFNLLLGNRYRTYVADCSLLTNPSTEYCLESYDNTGNTVPRTPEHHLNLSASYSPTANWRVTAEMDAISEYYADEINRVKIDGRQTFNLLMNYDRKLVGTDWSFFARIDNLFDESYYNTARGGTGDSDQDGDYDEEDISIVVNQGRTYTAGISVTF